MDNKKQKPFLEDEFELEEFKDITYNKFRKKRNEYNNKVLNKLGYIMVIISFILVYLLYNFFNKLIIERQNIKTDFSYNSNIAISTELL